jgi:DNA-binding transcriptional LysR family regulator
VARLKAEVITRTAGKIQRRAYALGEDQADASVEVRELRQTIRTTLFPDGSGLFTLTRNGQRFLLQWDAVPENLSDIELRADFNGHEGLLVAIPEKPE